MGAESIPFPTYRVLGFDVVCADPHDFAGWMARSAGTAGRTRMIALANTHMLVEGRRDPGMKQFLGRAIILPDGAPLVWVGKAGRVPIRGPIRGTDLMPLMLGGFGGSGLRHFFYGGRPEALDRMIEVVRSGFPDAVVCGAIAPPFRPLTPEEDARMVERINAAKPDLLWVGLGCPKQELWMDAHRDTIKAGFMLGVGQAFDLTAGLVPCPPRWIQNCGFEWLYRLCGNPRRLWKRYLAGGSLFFVLAAADAVSGAFHKAVGREKTKS
jgi:N-acetylglucosaminyldiphosphoundecaprenol N-acetyl-beta-D-mannosaminyltransferase